MNARSRGPLSIVAVWAATLPLLTGVPAELTPPTRRPAITDRLIHYWPNLWDVQDEITGRAGVVMGILPPAVEGVPDETPFNDETGWVQLPVALSAEQPWTVAVWLKAGPPIWSGSVVLGLHSSSHHWWLTESPADDHAHYQLVARGPQSADGPGFPAPRDTWHHVAVARSAAGSVTLWRDGVQQAEGHLAVSVGPEVQWITAGNDVKGDAQWNGELRDLCVFERVLSAAELGVLHAAGPSTVSARNTIARQAAVRRPDPVPWSTRVIPRSINEYTHRRFTAEDGLPANSIACVLQTRDRHLWVGTEAGIARFDGRRFRGFTPHNTPALSEVGADTRCLTEAADGTLWAAVYGGVLRLRGGEVTGFTHGLAEAYVLQAVPAGEDALWVAGFRTDRWYRGPCRVRRWHPETGHTSASLVVPGHVRRLVPTAAGLWMATEDPCQLLFWDQVSPTATVVAKLSGPPLVLGVRAGAGLPGNVKVRGWQHHQDPGRTVIEMSVGEGGPIFHWLTPTRRASASASRWMPSHKPHQWLGAQAGLARIVSEDLEVIHFSEGKLEVTCMAPNQEGGIWVGTDYDGLHLIKERTVRVFTTADGLSDNDVRTVIATPEGSVLAGGEAGLDEWKNGRWEARGLRLDPFMGKVLTVGRDPYGSVWFGLADIGYHPLRYLHLDAARSMAPPGTGWRHPNTMAVTPRGRIWVGCEYGITWLQPPGPVPASEAALHAWHDQVRYRRHPVGEQLPDAKFLKIVPETGDSVWAGTVGYGLLHLRGEAIERFTMQDGLPDDTCVPARTDADGTLWVVGNGTITRHREGRFQSLHPVHGIPEDRLLDLIEDDLGSFWLPGLRGIHRLHRTQIEACLDGHLDRVQCLTLGVRDGLRTPDCTSLHYPITAKTPDGQIWVATRGGLAKIEPGQVKVDAQPLVASIEEVVVNGRAVGHPFGANPRASLTLDPGSGERLEVHYTAVSLVAADRVRFRHRLVGYDADWAPETDLRLAFYTNLRPGRYRFEVKAANPYGVWNEGSTSLPFVIAPHFWQTRLFQLSVGLLVFTGIWLGHRQRLRVLGQVQALRHARTLSREKERIAADLHDEMGASLTQILILSELAKNHPAHPVTPLSTLERISTLARDVTSRISDLVWATSPRSDTLDSLVSYLREQLARQLDLGQVEGRFRFPERIPPCKVSATLRRNLVMAAKEAVNNALKHAQATTVEVDLSLGDDWLTLEVRDNGRGFDAGSSKGAGHGLHNMGRRLRDLGGYYELESAPGRGTRVCLTVALSATAV
jgi:signal transduction histidine kinase/ligand-binding sensor domain-containing protein